jgi:hypothetical protein
MGRRGRLSEDQMRKPGGAGFGTRSVRKFRRCSSRCCKSAAASAASAGSGKTGDDGQTDWGYFQPDVAGVVGQPSGRSVSQVVDWGEGQRG